MIDWVQIDTMRGEEYTSGEWIVLRKRGDMIFNVYKGTELRAIGFQYATSAMKYAEDFIKARKESGHARLAP